MSASAIRRRLCLEAWLLYLLAAGWAIGAGLAAWQAGAVDPVTTGHTERAVAALTARPHMSLAPLRDDQPPVPALLYLPVAAVCHAAGTMELAPAALGALLAGLLAVLLWGMLRDGGLSALARWLGVVPVVAAWCWLTHAGALEDWMAAATCALVGGIAAQVRWSLEGRLRDLLALALWLAMAVATRYELGIALGISAILVATQSVRLPGGWRRAEGNLLALLMPTAYIMLIWFGAGPGG